MKSFEEIKSNLDELLREKWPGGAPPDILDSLARISFLAQKEGDYDPNYEEAMAEFTRAIRKDNKRFEERNTE